MAFDEGFTRVPNDFLDWVFPTLSEAELRVLLYVIRRTCGFQKESDAISLNQFCRGIARRKSGTNLDLGCRLSREGVLRGIKGLVRRGILTAVRFGPGRGNVTLYRLAPDSTALQRIALMKEAATEKVNTLDIFPRRKRKGQGRSTRKAKDVAETVLQNRHAVDPQKIAFSKDSFSNIKCEISPINPLNTMKKNGSEHSQDCIPISDGFKTFCAQLVRVTGEWIKAALENKLRSKFSAWGAEEMLSALDTFSTEAYWLEFDNKNAAFFKYLEGVGLQVAEEEFSDPAIADL